MNSTKNGTAVPPPVLRSEDGPCQDVLTCPICCEIPLRPVVTTPCDHIFCRSCAEHAISNRAECPVCRQQMTMRNVKAIAGSLRRIWERIPVSCPAPKCQWVGMVGNYMAHAQACRCGPAFVNQAAIDQLEKAISDLKCSHKKELDEKDRAHKTELEERDRVLRKEIDALKLKINSLTVSFDASYRYDRFRVIELAQLICRNLLSLPPGIDRNRIFNCVKKCFDAYASNWDDNPEYLDTDVRMLLNVCRASTWFTDHQIDCFTSWCQSMGWS